MPSTMRILGDLDAQKNTIELGEEPTIGWSDDYIPVFLA